MFSAWGVFIRDYETFKCVSHVFVKKIHDSADIWGLFNLAHIRPTTENKKKTKKDKKRQIVRNTCNSLCLWRAASVVWSQAVLPLQVQPRHGTESLQEPSNYAAGMS